MFRRLELEAEHLASPWLRFCRSHDADPSGYFIKTGGHLNSSTAGALTDGDVLIAGSSGMFQHLKETLGTDVGMRWNECLICVVMDV